jgi:signal transduction histidine kinase/DNA-binding response OmpR family regulator
MKPSKNISLPFFFVTSLSIALMAVIIYARYQADKSITSLRKGNMNAANVFNVHVLRNEIVDGIYTVESSAANLSASKDVTLLKDTIQKIKENTALLDSIISTTENNVIGKKFTRLVNNKLQPFEKLLFSSNTGNSNLQAEARAIAAQTRPLTDSIYFAAIDLEDSLSNYLQKNIADNEKLAIKVSQIDLKLTFIIIAAIAILATIIILRLLQNFKLLKAVHTERLEAEKAAKVKEQFLANMSHEIRTPINSVVGFTNLLQKTDLKTEQHQYVALIKTAGENLLNIVNDILDISKIEAGMLHFDKSPFSVKEVCYNIEMMFLHKAKDKNLSLETFIDDSVPEMLMGDKERLSQILMNLTSNAVKFTQEGSITITVQCRSIKEDEATLYFAVKDTGVGIKKDKLNIIFERFEQAEADTTIKYGGTGLGLAIVKSLVTMQGGKLNVFSEEANGATFEFIISYGIYKQIAATQISLFAQPAASLLLPHASFKAKQILVAEDNKMNQLLLRKIFEQLKLHVSIAENGVEALQALQQQSFDLVLMDIQMPVMDGYTASLKIRDGLKSKVPIIAMTAKVLPGEKEKCMASGMNGYISKPIDETEFYNILITYLSKNIDTSTPIFVDAVFLNSLFSNSQEAVAEMTTQFIKQFPQELQMLTAAISMKDLAETRRVSHLMQTTVRAVNDRSLLYDHLMQIENADDTDKGWQVINENLAAFAKNELLIIQQAKDILAATNIDRQITV